jgi:hypothetical protein
MSALNEAFLLWAFISLSKPYSMARKVISTIGVSVIILGIIMMFFGAGAFSYNGSGLNAFLLTLGKFSFTYFLHTILIGIVLLIISRFID